MASLDTLYSCAEKIAASKDHSQLSGDFETILSGVNGNSACKRLSSQFISRFFPKFPALSQQALEAMLDLCEDEDILIRKQAIKDLPSLCREHKEYLPRIADILCQLLQAEDPSELGVVQTSLLSLLRKDAKGTLLGLFSQIKTGSDVTRERGIKFLHLKMKTEGKDLLPKDAEVVLFNEVKACLGDCTAAEFQAFMAMLNMTTIARTGSGQGQLLEVAAAMAQLEKETPFDAADAEMVDKLIQCTEVALGLFSAQAKSNRWVEYYCLQAIPQLHTIADADTQVTILKLLAEACTHLSETVEFKDASTATKNVFEKLLEYMPLPPEDAAEASAATTADEPQFEFTRVECLMIALHSVARRAPEYLKDDEDRLKDFRARLQYFARAVQAYIKKLREFVSGKSRVELEKDENKVKTQALRCTLNIQTIIKDLFHSPPIFKAKLFVSWKKQEAKSALKRPSISFDKETPKRSRDSGYHQRGRGSGASVYHPPTGKYSTSVDGYRENNSPRRGGGGRFRGGGGRGRRW